MDHIQRMMQIDYVAFFVTLFAILFGIKEIIELLSYFVKKFGVKFKRDTEKECMEDRVATLEKHDNWQYKEILKISKGIDDIKENLVKREITDKAKTVATLRGQLYGLHEKFVTKGYIDKSGLETFIELGKIYEAAGGDDIYHDKLYPEIMKLQIKDE